MGPLVRTAQAKNVAAGARASVVAQGEQSRDYVMGIVENKVGARSSVVCRQT